MRDDASFQEPFTDLDYLRNEFVDLGIFKHELKFTCLGCCRFTVSGVLVWNTGFIPIKSSSHSPDFLIFSCLQQATFILQVVSGLCLCS